MRNKDTILLEDAYDKVNNPKLNALKGFRNRIDYQPITVTSDEVKYLEELVDHIQDINNGIEEDPYFNGLVEKIKDNIAKENPTIIFEKEEREILLELLNDHKEIFIKYGDLGDPSYEEDVKFLDYLIDKFSK